MSLSSPSTMPASAVEDTTTLSDPGPVVTVVSPAIVLIRMSSSPGPASTEVLASRVDEPWVLSMTNGRGSATVPPPPLPRVMSKNSKVSS